MSACWFTVELQWSDGHRAWSHGMPEDEVTAYIDRNTSATVGLSDVDHLGPCQGTCSDTLH